MICTACRCPTRFAHTGLCRECRVRAHAPRITRRPNRTAQRWLAPEYFELRRARNLTPEQAVRRSELLFRELRLIFPVRVIFVWSLDNPYMATHARRTMVSYILRYGIRSAKKPVQSLRPISTRKATAA
jgi:hypothetical protein